MKIQNYEARSSSPPQWYAEFINNIPLGIFRTTLEGKLVFCNEALAEIFGFDSTCEMINYPVIQLYKNKKDRGTLIQALLRRGSVVDLPFSFKRRDGRDIWCAVTAKAVFDEDGIVVLLDGAMRDISREMGKRDLITGLGEGLAGADGMVFLLGVQGELLDLNEAGSRFFGIPREDLQGRPFIEFVAPQDRDMFPLLLSDVLRTGREETLMTMIGGEKRAQQFEFHAFLMKREGQVHHVKAIAKNLSENMKAERQRVSREKFRGVLEMAGGVAHKLNQPLMIINNLLNEVIGDLHASDRNYERIMRVHEQIGLLNQIGKKIAGIRKYEPMDYVAGIRIVDIDKAS